VFWQPDEQKIIAFLCSLVMVSAIRLVRRPANRDRTAPAAGSPPSDPFL